MSFNPTFHHDGCEPFDPEVFVFGSNTAGYHGAGSAKVAYEKYGAIAGIGHGLMGQSYAIATRKIVNRRIISLTLDEIALNIKTFCDFTWQRDDLKFFVTAVACGYAGFFDYQIAPLFKKSNNNCSYPTTWYKYLRDDIIATRV